jgi:hypothetical protein
MKDARTERKHAYRTAEVTVWNVTSLVLDEEGTPANFKIGQRFRVRVHILQLLCGARAECWVT